jgi:hypothetical protein
MLIAAWSVAVVYFKIVDSKGANKKHWDIWSWSCYRRTHNPSLGKISWEALCIESVSRIKSARILRLAAQATQLTVLCLRIQNYTFFASIVITVLEITGLLLFVTSQRNIKTRAIYRQVQSVWN